MCEHSTVTYRPADPQTHAWYSCSRTTGGGTVSSRPRSYSETRLWQVVDHLIDQPAALAAYPTLVHRLQRTREQRRGVRRGSGSGSRLVG